MSVPQVFGPGTTVGLTVPRPKPKAQGTLKFILTNEVGETVLEGRLPDHEGEVNIYIQNKWDVLHYKGDSPSRPSKWEADKKRFEVNGKDIASAEARVLREYDKQS